MFNHRNIPITPFNATFYIFHLLKPLAMLFDNDNICDVDCKQKEKTMKKLALILLISSSANAAITGQVYTSAIRATGFVGASTTLTCTHKAPLKNVGTVKETVYIADRLCPAGKECKTNLVEWKLMPGQEWTHTWTSQTNVVYRDRGNFQFSCLTSVVGIGQVEEIGMVTIT